MTLHAKRKQLVNQLRKAHFPFGFQHIKDPQSQYIQKYKQYEIKMKQQQAQNARKTNFEVTDPNGETNYLSQFKQKYPQHQLIPKQDLLKNKKQQIDKNFIFGYDPNNFATNYKDDYDKKQANYQKAKPVTQKQPNINFGDSLNDYATTYNQVHNAKQPSKVAGFDPQAIRKSNMILGNNIPNYQTQHNATFTPMPLSAPQPNQRSHITNINFGGDGNAFLSQQKQNYSHKQSGPQVIDKQKVKDFRNAHFHFGFPQPTQLISQARQKYDQKPIDYKKASGNRPSNIHLNTDDKNYYDSTYNNQYQGKPGQKLQPIKPSPKIGNIMLGADQHPDHYTSQSKAQYCPKTGTIPQRVKPINQSGSLDLGKGPGDYLTHHQDTYTDKFNLRQNNKLSKQDIARLKGNNFTNGFQNNDYGLSSEEYGKVIGNANKLPKDILDSMKKANVGQNGENPFKGGTTYKTSYHWKKNDQY